jgi:hypothetical protein
MQVTLKLIGAKDVYWGEKNGSLTELLLEAVVMLRNGILGMAHNQAWVVAWQSGVYDKNTWPSFTAQVHCFAGNPRIRHLSQTPVSSCQKNPVFLL